MPSSIAAHRLARAPSGGRRRAGALRWVVVCGVVLAFHWRAAQWLEHHRGDAPPERVPVQIALLKPERVEQGAAGPAQSASPVSPTAPHAANRAQTRAPRTPHVLSARNVPDAPPATHRPAKQPKRRQTATPEAKHGTRAAHATADKNQNASAAPQATADANTANAPVSAAAPDDASSVPDTPSASSSATTNASAPAKTAPVSHGAKFSIPPSGDLQYDTFYNGVRNQSGTIHWKSTGKRYEMVVSVPIPFIGTLSWTSRGHIDAFGLAPDQYVERFGHRREDVTTFERAARQIAFTRTSATLALPDGAQDRFSMVMQLASLVRGDPSTYRPGVAREFYVADNDSGENWPVMTIGDESVRIDQGFVTARHFKRLPRRAGDRRSIDVWLAPSLGWLPVRILQTEPNGTEFELLWRGPLALPNAPNETQAAQGGKGADTSNAGASAAQPPAQSDGESGTDGDANGDANGDTNDDADNDASGKTGANDASNAGDADKTGSTNHDATKAVTPAAPAPSGLPATPPADALPAP